MTKTIDLYDDIERQAKVEMKPRTEVMRFAEAMEERLQENDHKHHWSNYTPQQMFERLKDEMEELTWAFSSKDKMLECVDVANFAMIIWDLLTAEEQEDE